MTEHRNWFTTFKPIPSGTWSVTVADDRNLWVQGVGDIHITRIVDGINKKGVLRKVLYIPELRRNLFSIGLASKSGLSFQTLGDRCALFQDLGKGPKVMEGVQTGTLYRLSIDPIPPSSSEIVSTSTQTPSTTLTIASATDSILKQSKIQLHPQLLLLQPLMMLISCYGTIGWVMLIHKFLRR